MIQQIAAILLLINLFNFSLALWEKESDCPSSCTCRLEHLSETAIYRFIKRENNIPGEIGSFENNDVLNEDNLILNDLEGNHVLRSATCILETETDPVELLDKLPRNLDTIVLIQGYKSGNKTIKFSYFDQFENLLSLELIGPNDILSQLSGLLCEIDVPLSGLKYLNLESVLIKNSKKHIQEFVEKIAEEDVTFEYVVQKHDSNSHPLTIVQKGTNEEILPYKVFKEKEGLHQIPLFIGFKDLYLLRITNCDIKNVHWEMFDGLQNLRYLILEKNNLRFIPAFAFYGTPNLISLSLAHNNLLDIELTDLAGLLELEYLDLSYNNFSQLSELSLPPFPKLKLADFGNNPIGIIFPNTFEVMNTTDSLIIGSDDMPLTLLTNSFIGLNLLKKLTLKNLNQTLLKRDLLVGMPNLQELIMTGYIKEIEYDAFLEVNSISTLILSRCQLINISMDAFMGLQNLHFLDLSYNNLEYLPPGLFDHLIHIKEIYLNNNKLKQLPRDIFHNIHPKLLRLNENPWHCSCEMSEWKPMIVNKIKQRVIKNCDIAHDKQISCVADENRYIYKYLYENKVAPKCSEPKHFANWSVFHAMRKIFKCPNYKPKFRKRILKKFPTSSNLTEIKNDINNKQDNFTHFTSPPVVVTTKLENQSELNEIGVDIKINSDSNEKSASKLKSNHFNAHQILSDRFVKKYKIMQKKKSKLLQNDLKNDII